MATPTITDTKRQEDNSHQVNGEAPAVVGAVTLASLGWDLSNDTREEVAAILEQVAEEGLPMPRDLDVALDAIGQCIRYDRVTADVPSTLGAGGDDDAK